MMLRGPCGTFPMSPVVTCEACGRRIRCVYTVDDGGWLFFLGRRCFERLQSFSAAAHPAEAGKGTGS